MADLQEELQRFLTARFGVDVKDAFVSCIQKIHKENQDVAALEQPMKDATQQVLDIREEITAVSQNASKTAEDAKPSPGRLKATQARPLPRRKTPRTMPSMPPGMQNWLWLPLSRWSRTTPPWN